MQFLAFLKDSFREARNGWVLQAMLVLSALLVLFVASISFTKATPIDGVATPLRLINWGLRNTPDTKGGRIEIENYRSSNPKEPWNADHEFDFFVRTETAEELKKIEENRGFPVSRARVERFIKQNVRVLDNLKVEQSETGKLTELKFHVSSRGTKSQDATSWPHVPKIFFALEAPLFTMSLRSGVYLVEKYVISVAGTWVVVFISVIITASFIPNLLQKGSVDLAISKPIGRTRLLIYKYCGGLIFTFLLTTCIVGGSWFVLGVRTGLWNHNFLLVIPLVVFYFAALYAVSALIAVVTRSAILAILATLMAWGASWGIGYINGLVLEREANVAEQMADPNAQVVPRDNSPEEVDRVISRIDPEAPILGFVPVSTFGAIKAIHFITPRIYQLDDELNRLIARGILTDRELEDRRLDKPRPTGWVEILGITTLFIAFVLGLASWRFSTRSF